MRVLLARTSVQSRPFGISSPLSRIAGCLISQSSTLLLVGKAGWLASGTRGRLICQLRQFGPPLCGPPYRRPPAESSHGSYGRRALFQELSIFFQILLGCFFYFFSPCLLPFFWPPLFILRGFPWPGSSCCITVVVFAGVACVGVVVNVS